MNQPENVSPHALYNHYLCSHGRTLLIEALLSPGALGHTNILSINQAQVNLLVVGVTAFALHIRVWQRSAPTTPIWVLVHEAY
jgi:hypothetical protein